MELKRYWEIICRRKRLIIQAVLIITGTALLSTFLIAPIYGISAKVFIKIEDRQPALVSDPAMTSQTHKLGETSYAEPRNLVDTHIALLNTQPVLHKVIDELKLKDIFGRTIEVKDFIISAAKYPFLILFQKKGVQLRRVGAAELMEITGYSPDLVQAAQIANLAAQSFADLQAELFRREARAARTGLEKQLAEVQKKLGEAKEREAIFRSENNLPDVATQTTTLISENSTLETRRFETERNIRGYQSNLTTINKHLKKYPEFLKKKIVFEKNPLIKTYKENLLNFEVEMAGALMELTESHPEITKLKNKISEIKAGILKEIAKTFSEETTERNPYFDSLIESYGNTQISIISQKAILNVIDKQMEDKANQLKMMPIKKQKLDRFSKETDVLDSFYLSLKQRLEWLKLLETLDISNTVTVQEAIPANRPKVDKFFPKRLKILVFSLLLGLPFGLLLACVKDYLDDTIKTPQEVIDTLQEPVLGIIPQVDSIGLETLPGKRNSEFWEQFWNLHSNVELAALHKEGNILAITSVRPGEGKTTVCNCLASVYAESGKRVLLVDLNLRRPHLHTIFQLSDFDRGVANFLVGESELRQVIYPTSKSNIYVLPAGPVKTNSLKIIGLPEMRQLVDSIRGDYDQIIFDTPSQEDGSDLSRIALFADNLLLVLTPGYVSENKVRQTLAVLKTDAKNVLGVVLNKAEAPGPAGIFPNYTSAVERLAKFFHRS